jgi:hypothetical protein
MSKFLRVNVAANLGPGNRYSASLPQGYTYNRLWCELSSGITAAKISNIEIGANTKLLQQWRTAAHLNSFNAYRGNFMEPSVLEFDFTEKRSKSVVTQTQGCLSLHPALVQNASLSFDLDGTVTAGSSITLMAEHDPQSTDPVVTRVRSLQLAPAAAMEHTFDLPYGNSGDQIKRIMLFGANITSVRIRRNGIDEVMGMQRLTNELIQRSYGMSPQAGCWIVDFIVSQLVSEAMNTANLVSPGPQQGTTVASPVTSAQMLITTSAATTINCYIESYSTVGQL